MRRLHHIWREEVLHCRPRDVGDAPAQLRVGGLLRHARTVPHFVLMVVGDTREGQRTNRASNAILILPGAPERARASRQVDDRVLACADPRGRQAAASVPVAVHVSSLVDDQAHRRDALAGFLLLRAWV